MVVIDKDDISVRVLIIAFTLFRIFPCVGRALMARPIRTRNKGESCNGRQTNMQREKQKKGH